MSEIVKDKKVLETTRKDKLKGVDADLRDQIVKKLQDKLETDKVGEMVVSVWTKGNANRQTALTRQQAFLQSWDDHLIADNDGPFRGSSNLHIPVTFTVLKTVHARFFQALMGQDPPFSVKARNEASIERIDTVTDLTRYAILDWANYNKGCEATVDKWVWDWAGTGLGIMKERWERKFESFTDVRKSKKKSTPKFAPSGELQPVMVDVEEEFENTKKVFDGPMVDNVLFEDVLIEGGNGDPDLADVVIHRQYETASSLWQKVDQKIYNEEAVRRVIEHGQDHQSIDSSGAIKVQRATNAGKASVDTEQDLDRYEILEAYMQYDVKGSGINSEIVVWVHKNTRAILRATYLRRVSQSGERPFITSVYHRRHEDSTPVGIIELMYPLSREMDAIHNMRLDFGMISTMPFGFYRATSGIDPETIQLEPGALIPVDNPQTDVFFPNLGNRTVFGMQEENSVQQMIERLTSITDMNMGMISGQGATRTATGARALVGEASSNLDVHLRRLNQGWKKFLKYLFHMLQQRLPPGLEFRITGEDGKDYWRTVKTPEEIAGDFDFEVSPCSDSSNKQLQVQTAQEILQVVSNPLAIQLQCVGPGQFFEAVKNYLQALGVKDWTKYLAKPQGYEHVPTPEEEANRVLRGITVPVTPNMDHQGFIDFFEHLHSDDHLLGQFSQEQAIALKIQEQKHVQMLQAVKQMQAQSANAQQMRTNASMATNAAAPQMGQQIQGGMSTPPPAAPQQ